MESVCTDAYEGLELCPILTIVEDEAYCASSQRGDAGVTVFAPDGLLTVREVAEAMRVSTMTVYRLIKAGELPAIRVGKHFRIRRRDLTGYLDSRMVGMPDTRIPGTGASDIRTAGGE
jgi:excisionase family DNA binding protein